MNSPALAQLVADNPAIAVRVDAGDYVGAAAAFNALTETTLIPCMIRWRTLDDLFDAVTFKAIRTAFDATVAGLKGSGNAAMLATGERLERADGYMRGTSDAAGIDVGRQSVRDDINALVGTVFTREQADAVLALGITTVPVWRRVLGREADFGDFTPPANGGGQG